MEEVEETQEEILIFDVSGSGVDENPLLFEDMFVEVNELEIIKGGKFALYLNYNTLTGANIHIHGKRIFMDGEYNHPFTGIFAQPQQSDQEGSWGLSITAIEQLELLNGSRISTTRKGIGKTNLQVQSPFITINGDASARASNESNTVFLPTGIFSQNQLAKVGGAGNITMSGIERLELRNGGRISTTINDDNLNDSNILSGGNISIQADTIMIDRNNYAQATGIFAQNHDNSFRSSPGDIFWTV